MKYQFVITCFILSALTHYSQAQQWTGSTDTNGLIERNGNIKANGLWFGNYGASLLGDSAPYMISSPANGENHDLLLFGNNTATLNLRLVDGDFKLGSNTAPDAILYNSGSAFFNGKIGIGVTSPLANLQIGQSTMNGLINMGGYAHIGSLQSSGDLFIGMNVHAKYLDVSDNSTVRVLNSNSYGFSALQMSYNGNITFYTKNGSVTANDQANSTSNAVLKIAGSGNVGIGTTSPEAKLDVMGHIKLDPGGSTNPTIYIGTGTSELNKYLALINSPGLTSAGGLKAGGILVSDSYSYANPGKNDLIVKGNIGVGTASPASKLDVAGQLKATAQFHLGDNYSINGRGITVDNGASTDWVFFTLRNNNGTHVKVLGNGNVGIGTNNPDAKLAVKGTVHAEEVKVDLSVPGPDYVFEPGYNLPTLTEIETYIKANKHLPEVPSAKEMETNGVNLSEMNMLLLKKVEELTLHLIEMKKENNETKKENERQNKLILELLNRK